MDNIDLIKFVIFIFSIQKTVDSGRLGLQTAQRASPVLLVLSRTRPAAESVLTVPTTTARQQWAASHQKHA